MRSLLLVVKDDVSVDGGIFGRSAQFDPPIVEDDGVVGRGISKRLAPPIVEDGGIVDGGKSEG